MTQFSSRPLKNFTEIFNEATPQLSVMRMVDKAATEIAVAYLIAKLCKRINVVRNMNADQISECAKTIVADYWLLTYDDIALALDMGYKNKFSDDKLAVFDRMDESIILRWLMVYDGIRTQRYRQHQAPASVYGLVATDPVYTIVKQVADKLSIKEQTERDLAPKPERKPDIYQLCMNEFDKLCRAAPVANASIPMAMYNGKPVDLAGYVDIRVVEMMEELK